MKLTAAHSTFIHLTVLEKISVNQPFIKGEYKKLIGSRFVGCVDIFFLQLVILYKVM